MGLINQEIINEEAKLANGETITVSTKHPSADKTLERVVDTLIGSASGWNPLGIAVKAGLKLVDNVPALPDRGIPINRRDDGVYEIVQSKQPTTVTDTRFNIKRDRYIEIHPDGQAVVTREVRRNVTTGTQDVKHLNLPDDDFDLGEITHGRAVFIDGEVRISPELREEFERPTAMDSSPP